MKTYEFIDSAFDAGFPYVLEIVVKVDGQMDGSELRSYKDSATAWRDASRKLGEIFELYKEDNAVAWGHIWRCKEGPLERQHDLICTIGSYDRGSWRFVTRHIYNGHDMDMKTEVIRR